MDAITQQSFTDNGKRRYKQRVNKQYDKNCIVVILGNDFGDTTVLVVLVNLLEAALLQDVENNGAKESNR